jgi:hypothetical protein
VQDYWNIVVLAKLNVLSRWQEFLESCDCDVIPSDGEEHQVVLVGAGGRVTRHPEVTARTPIVSCLLTIRQSERIYL